MTDINSIPTSELKSDLIDSYEDIEVCKLALSINIISYSGGSVQERLDKNKQFIKVIFDELERRQLVR